MGLENKLKWGDVQREYDNPLDFYNEHYSGLTRGELIEEDRSFYDRLRLDGLLEHVPLKQVPGDFGSDPVAYYHEHYAGLTRGQFLYRRLRKDGLLEHVPLKSDNSIKE